MALFLDGFEQFAKTDRPEQFLRLAGYKLQGAVSLVNGRKSGSQALSLYRALVSRAWTFSGDVMSFGFAVYFDQRGPIASIRSGTADILTLAASAETGLLNYGGEVGYVNPLLKRWYYIELEFDKAAGISRVYVNGKLDIAVTLPATVTGNLTVVLNPYEAAANDFGTRNYDDFYINDAAHLTPMQITTRFPTSTVSDEWSVTGAGTHHEAVSPPIDLLNKFIYTAKGDAYDAFLSSTKLPDNNPIRYLQLITLFRKATSDPMSLELNIDDQKVTVANIPRDWTFRYTMMSAAGYDATNILQAEFGVRLKL